jgi:hypothetical protein
VASSLKLDKSQVNFKIRFGADNVKQHKTIGRWPTGNQNNSVEMPGSELKLSYAKDVLSGTIIAKEEIFLREIQISIKIKSRKGIPLYACGTYAGSPSLTISDQREIIRLKRNKVMKQFITFEYNPSRRILNINWQFNCFMPNGKELVFDPIRITENETALQPSLGKTEPKLVPRTSWIAESPLNQPLRINYIEENLNWMEKERFFFDMIQLNGLHNTIGDWENLPPEFRGKIGFINRRIEHNGMIPAIAFAPFHAEAGSELVRLHPDWLVGELKGDSPLVNQQNHKKMYILDFTQISVREYIKSTLDLFYRQWGFKAFHLQGLSALLLPCRRSDNEKESGEILHEALLFFREILGAKTFISAENIPLITQENVLSMISMDSSISSKRKSKKEIPETIYRVLNQTFTSQYPWLFNSGNYPLPEEKELIHPQAAESLRQMMLISGGSLSINNNLNKMTQNQVNELKKLIPSFKRFAGGSLHLINSPDKKHPSVLFNSRGYLGVFNLSGKKKQTSLNMESMRLRFYNKKSGTQIKEGRTGMKTGELELILPPYGSRIFKF